MSAANVSLSPLSYDPTVSPVRFDGSKSPHCLLECIMIYLCFPGSSPTPMRVLESDSIASVKLRIQTCKGVVVKRQRLVFDGRELARNKCLVRDYGVGDGNILHLIVRLSDLRPIVVETVSGRTFELQVDGSRDVGYVKEQIGKRDKGLVDLDDQKLIYGGQELDENRIIDDICESSDAIIHLLVRRSAKLTTRAVDKSLEISIVAPNLDGRVPPGNLKTSELRLPEKDFWVEPVVGNPKVVLSPMIKEFISSVFAGLDKGHSPIPSSEGSGGAYFMKNASGDYVAVFKPVDEEPMAVNNPQGLPLSTNGEGLKRGTRVGEGALREVAAYILDHPISGRRSFPREEVGFAGVPPTVMVRCLHKGFNHPQGYEYSTKNFKLGSLQMFAKNFSSCEDMGPGAFPVSEVHKISVFDIRLANADRHGGNILACKDGEDGQFVLVPIDHGYCLPETLEDCTFEWLYWPQSQEPYSPETVEYIKSFDADNDIDLLKFHGWELSTECSRVLRISTMLLKKGAERGLTPFTIGNMMCRETLKKKSVIEEIVAEAKQAVLPDSSEATFMETVSLIMDRRLDEWDEGCHNETKPSSVVDDDALRNPDFEVEPRLF